jgi:hypothetical protein
MKQYKIIKTQMTKPNWSHLVTKQGQISNSIIPQIHPFLNSLSTFQPSVQLSLKNHSLNLILSFFLFFFENSNQPWPTSLTPTTSQSFYAPF